MAESSADKDAYEQKIRERFSRQKQFEFMIPAPRTSETKEAAN